MDEIKIDQAESPSTYQDELQSSERAFFLVVLIFIMSLS